MFPAPYGLTGYRRTSKFVRGLWMAFYKSVYGRYAVDTRQGLHLLFDLNNSMDKWTITFGDYERAQRSKLFAMARAAQAAGAKPMAFIDVGAHWGWYGLLAEREGIFSRVVCFEADPTNMDQLRANLFLNRLSTRIEAVQAAASSVSGSVRFSAATGNHRTTAKVAAKGPDASAPTIEVKAMALDDLAGLNGHVLVFKIDVEGHEASVLAGAQQLLQEETCVLQVEIFDRNFPAVEQQLNALGYVDTGRIGNDHFFERASKT